MKLYHINCKALIKEEYKNIYDGLYNHQFDGNFPFKEEPSKEECIALIKFLKHRDNFAWDSLTITYVKNCDL